MSEAERRPVGCHHVWMMEDLKALAIKYDAMPVVEMIALVSQFTGGLTFLMDPERLDPRSTGLMVISNLNEGYKNARENSPLMNPEGSA